MDTKFERLYSSPFSPTAGSVSGRWTCPPGSGLRSPSLYRPAAVRLGHRAHNFAGRDLPPELAHIDLPNANLPKQLHEATAMAMHKLSLCHCASQWRAPGVGCAHAPASLRSGGWWHTWWHHGLQLRHPMSSLEPSRHQHMFLVWPAGRPNWKVGLVRPAKNKTTPSKSRN